MKYLRLVLGNETTIVIETVILFLTFRALQHSLKSLQFEIGILIITTEATLLFWLVYKYFSFANNRKH